MMGECRNGQDALFYEFSLERHVPERHLLRAIDRFVELDGLRRELTPFYSEVGRPSIDPELMIRMLIVGYCFGIRSERRLCEEVHLNLGYRWFCRLGLDGSVPDHSTFSKNRHGRFREVRRGRMKRWLRRDPETVRKQERISQVLPGDDCDFPQGGDFPVRTIGFSRRVRIGLQSRCRRHHGLRHASAGRA